MIMSKIRRPISWQMLIPFAVIAACAAVGALRLLGMRLPVLVSGGMISAGAYGAVFLGLLAWLVFRPGADSKFSIPTALIAMVLTFFAVVGFSLQSSGGMSFFFPGSILVRVIAYGALCAVVYTVIIAVYALVDRSSSGKQVIRQRSAFWMAFAVIVLCWIPFLVAGYPGSVPKDTLHQLQQFAGEKVYNASNPLLVTWIFGGLFQIGRLIGGDSLGIFLNVLFQVVLCGAAMARISTLAGRISRSRGIYTAAVVFFGVLPTWGAAVQCVLKDTVHLGFFLLFLASYTETLLDKQEQGRQSVELALWACLTALSRKAAFAIVLVSLIVLVVYRVVRRQLSRKILTAAAAAIAGYFAVQVLILVIPNVEAPMERENYSLPFQMIARYCVEHDQELTQQEIAAIDSVLDYKTILTSYNPDISDPVKKTFRGEDADMAAFWKLFLRLGLRHPETYIRHLLAGTYKYTWPLSAGAGGYRNYIAPKQTFYNVSRVSEAPLNAMVRYFSIWEKGGITTLLMGPGLYVWIVILLLGYGWKNRSVGLLTALVPVLVLLIGLFFSHVNGENRYAYPLIAAVPLYLALAVRKK